MCVSRGHFLPVHFITTFVRMAADENTQNIIIIIIIIIIWRRYKPFLFVVIRKICLVVLISRYCFIGNGRNLVERFIENGRNLVERFIGSGRNLVECFIEADVT